MQQPPQKYDEMTLWQKSEAVQWLARYPALTVMVFIRRDIGYRLLNPIHFAVMAFVLFIIAGTCNPDKTPEGILAFIPVMLLFAAAQRFRRWREFRRGVRQHSFYIGTSRFEWRWLPAFCRRDRRIERHVDPFIAVFLGFLVSPLSAGLALWIAFGGLCIAVYEDVVRRREFNRRLDMVDGLVESEIAADAVEHFSGPQPEEQRQAQEQASGVPTGLGDDIQGKIKKTKRELHHPKSKS